MVAAVDDGEAVGVEAGGLDKKTSFFVQRNKSIFRLIIFSLLKCGRTQISKKQKERRCYGRSPAIVRQKDLRHRLMTLV